MKKIVCIILVAMLFLFIGCEIPDVDETENDAVLDAPQRVLSLIGQDIDYSGKGIESIRILSDGTSIVERQKSHASENIASMGYRELLEKILSNDISQYNDIEFDMYYPIEGDVEYSSQTVEYVKSQFAGWTEEMAEEMLSTVKFKGLQVNRVSDVEASVYACMTINNEDYYMLIDCTVNEFNIFDRIMYLYAPENKYGDGDIHAMVTYETVEYSSEKKTIKTISNTDSKIASSCVYYVGTDGVFWYQNGYGDHANSFENLHDIRYLSPEGYGFQWTKNGDEENLEVFDSEGILIGYMSSGIYHICGSVVEEKEIDKFEYNYYSEWVTVSGYSVKDFSDAEIPDSFKDKALLTYLVEKKDEMRKTFDSINFDDEIPSMENVLEMLEEWGKGR